MTELIKRAYDYVDDKYLDVADIPMFINKLVDLYEENVRLVSKISDLEDEIGRLENRCEALEDELQGMYE